MTFTVYLVGTNTPSAVQFPTIAVGNPVPAGDTIVLSVSVGGSLGVNIWSVTDSHAGSTNTWNMVQQSILGQGMWQLTCLVTTALTTSDTITVGFSVAADVKTMAAIGINGAATSGTLLDQWAQSSGSGTAMSVTSPSLGNSAELAIAVFGAGSGGGAPTLGGGWTQAAQAHGSGSAWLTVAYQALSASTAVTASATITSTAWGAAVLTLAPQGGVGAKWLQSVAGAPSQNSFQVVSKLSGATSVRLKVGTNLALTTGVQFSPAQVPDAYGYVRHTAPGLVPGTQYYCQAADTPSGGSESLLGPVGMCKTLPPAGSPQSFRMSLVSCVIPQASDTSGIDDLVAWNADLNVFTGDQSYSDTQSTDFRNQLQVYEQQAALTGIGSAASAAAGFPSSYSMMHARAWGYYCRSDHEAGPDNGDSGPAASVPYIPVNIAAAQQAYPYGILGDTANAPVHGLWQSWVIGRIRFIMIDNRTTDRSPGANTDNSSKTMLGTQQLTWFENQLLMPEPMKIIIGDVQWAGSGAGGLDASGPDKWWNYSTERSAIISFITANAARVGKLAWMHGDSHLLGAMTGTANATWGGFPVYCAAPLNNVGGGLNTGVWSTFYDASSGNARQYGRITITDDGSTITLAFTGWDALNQVAQVTQTDTFSCPPARAATGSFAGLAS